MKVVTAFVKQHKLPDVTLALHGVAGLTGMSATTVHGFGRGKGSGRPTGEETHARIEIFCPDGLVEEVIAVLLQAAHTGLRGDGKIYVSEVQTAIRISTGERGEAAV